MKLLSSLVPIEATLRLVSAMHIGTGDSPLGGGAELTASTGLDGDVPCIPGSTIKGRMRALLASRVDDPTHRDHTSALDPLFGRPGLRGALSFWDGIPDADWVAGRKDAGLPLVQTRTEQQITLRRGSGATPQRQVRARRRQVVPAGTPFQFRLALDSARSPDLDLVLCGLRLLEWEGLGAGTSRGMGRVRFEGLRIGGRCAQARLDAIGEFCGTGDR